VNYRIVDYIDTPEVLDTSVTPIPGSGSSPLQIVSNLYAQTSHLLVKDGIQDRFIGVYKGSPGSEILVCIIGVSADSELAVDLPAGTRVSLRSMDASPVNSGSLCIQFAGVA
jgi:hypothetical protein